MLCESSFPNSWLEKTSFLALCDCWELFLLIFSNCHFLGLRYFSYTHVLNSTQLNTQRETYAATFLSLCGALLPDSVSQTLATLFSSDLNSVFSIEKLHWLLLGSPFLPPQHCNSFKALITAIKGITQFVPYFSGLISHQYLQNHYFTYLVNFLVVLG